MNKSNNGHCRSACVSEKNTHGATREDTYSGVRGEDQSTRDYQTVSPGPSNPGNVLPPVPMK